MNEFIIALRNSDANMRFPILESEFSTKHVQTVFFINKSVHNFGLINDETVFFQTPYILKCSKSDFLQTKNDSSHFMTDRRSTLKYSI